MDALRGSGAYHQGCPVSWSNILQGIRCQYDSITVRLRIANLKVWLRWSWVDRSISGKQAGFNAVSRRRSRCHYGWSRLVLGGPCCALGALQCYCRSRSRVSVYVVIPCYIIRTNHVVTLFQKQSRSTQKYIRHTVPEKSKDHSARMVTNITTVHQGFNTDNISNF